jgi:hypothetical protein
VKLACCICCSSSSFCGTLPLSIAVHGGINSLNRSGHLFDPLSIDLGVFAPNDGCFECSVWVIHPLFFIVYIIFPILFLELN